MRSAHSVGRDSLSIERENSVSCLFFVMETRRVYRDAERQLLNMKFMVQMFKKFRKLAEKLSRETGVFNRSV